MANASIQLERREYPDDQKGQTVLTGLAKYCYDLYEEYKESEYRRRKLDEIEDARKMYNEYLTKSSDDDADWRANYTLGLAGIVVDSIEPKIVASCFGDEDFVHIAPVGPEDAPAVDAAREAIRYLTATNMDAEAQLQPVIHDLLIDGTQFLIPMWREGVTTFPVREQVPVFVAPNGERVPIQKERLQDPAVMQAVQMGMLRPAGMEEVESERDVTEFRVEIDAVPVTEAFFPDTGDDWENQPFLRRIYPTFAELSAGAEDDGPYKNIDESLIETDARDTVDDPDPDLEWKEIDGSELAKEVAVLECYVRWRGEWTLASFAIHNGWREIRRQKVSEVFPFARKPVHRWALYRESNEALGKGLVKKIQHYHEGSDKLYNQMIDAGTVQITPFGWIEEGPGSPGLDLMSTVPGEYKPIPHGTRIHDRQVAVTAGAFQPFIQMLLQMQERKVSLMDHTLTGGLRGGAGSETYAGMNLLLHESNIRHNYLASRIKKDMAKLIRDAVSLYGWFMPFDARRRVLQNNRWIFDGMDVAALQHQFDFEINVANHQANTMLNRQEAIERFQILAANPIVNQQKLLVDILSSYQIKNVQDYIRPEINQLLQVGAQLGPEAIQVLQQHMAQKQQQANTQKLTRQAKDNVERSAIHRQIEEPIEMTKTADQVSEQAQRKAMQPLADMQMRGRM